jgi:hypothetical protein
LFSTACALKPRSLAVDPFCVEQDTIEDLGFSLDLIYLASGLGCQDSNSCARSTPCEVEELEEMMRAVLASAESELDGAGRA